MNRPLFQDVNQVWRIAAQRADRRLKGCARAGGRNYQPKNCDLLRSIPWRLLIGERRATKNAVGQIKIAQSVRVELRHTKRFEHSRVLHWTLPLPEVKSNPSIVRNRTQRYFCERKFPNAELKQSSYPLIAGITRASICRVRAVQLAERAA